MKTGRLRLLALWLVTFVFAAAQASEVSLSSGRWVKVGIDTTGIYKISAGQLREWGFDKPSEVVVYGAGGVDVASNSFQDSYTGGLPPAPSIRTAEGDILFFAEGCTRGVPVSKSYVTFSQNFYDTRAFYFLAQTGEDTTLKPQEDAITDNTQIESHLGLQLVERDLSNPGRGGAIYMGRPIGAGKAEAFAFDISDFDSPDPEASGSFIVQGGINTTNSAHHFTLEADGAATITDIERNTLYSNKLSTVCYRTTGLTASFTRSKAESATAIFKVGMPDEFSGNYAAVDKACIVYPRANTIGAKSSLIINLCDTWGQLIFPSSPSDLEVWEVSEPLHARRLSVTFEGASATARVNKSPTIRLIAFSPSAEHPAPEYAGEVPNTDLHSIPTPDILIISAPDLTAQAEELAECHRSIQGLDVAVAAQQDIFNEFSCGSRTPAALRRFAKMLYDRKPGKLRHIILYGASTYQNRTIDYDSGSFLVSFQAEDPAHASRKNTNYCADQYFEMLSDNYRHSNIINERMLVNVGRIPARTPAQAQAANAKIRRFLENPPDAGFYLSAIAGSCDGDKKYEHIIQTSEACDRMSALNPLIRTRRVDSYFYPAGGTAKNPEYPDISRSVGNALANGTGVFIYCGHGGIDGCLMYTPHILDRYSYLYAPLGIFASCEIFGFDRDGGKMGERMLLKSDGGMTAIIASCRDVIQEHNQGISTTAAEVYATLKPGATYGDILRLVRDRIIDSGTSAGLGQNTLCYNFGGDPAIPVPVPEFGIAADNGPATLKPLETIEIRGYITDKDGKTIKNFNGDITAVLHDAPVTLTNLRDKQETHTAQTEQELLCIARGTVADGQFSVSVTIPESATAGEGKRLSLTARSSDGKLAAGIWRGISTSAEPAENSGTQPQAPSVQAIYIDTEDKSHGCVTAPDIVLHVLADPSPGGLLATSGLRGGIRLTLDGTTNIHELSGCTSFTADGLLHISKPFSNLAEGPHTIDISISNSAGESTRESISFTVAKDLACGQLHLCDHCGGPVRDTVRIDLTHTVADCAGRRLLILDAAGRTVRSVADCTFPYSWDLTDNSGQPVPDGRYTLSALIKGTSAAGSTPPLKIVVLR